MASYYQVKRIEYLERHISILTQSENGPCPLLAISNTLILNNKLFINPDYGAVGNEELVSMIVDLLLEQGKQSFNNPNWDYRIQEAIQLIHKLSVGLDVNVKFLGFDQFEFTAECDVFEIFGIRLVHGWVVEGPEETKALQDFNYNQAADFIVSNTMNEKTLFIRKFFEENSSQLTRKGLKMIESGLNDGEVAVFFRNNHFSTIFKYFGKIYALATDVGFVEAEEVVWECLDNIDGNNHFCNSFFIPLEQERNSIFETIRIKKNYSVKIENFENPFEVISKDNVKESEMEHDDQKKDDHVEKSDGNIEKSDGNIEKCDQEKNSNDIELKNSRIEKSVQESQDDRVNAVDENIVVEAPVISQEESVANKNTKHQQKVSKKSCCLII